MTATRRHRRQLEQAVALHNAGDLTGAATLYEPLVAANPGEWESAFLLGVLRFQQGSFGPARELLERVARLNPAHADAWFYLGEVHRAAATPEAAVMAYERATALAPTRELAWFGLGLVLEGLGRSREAVLAYERALALRADFAEALNNLGSLRRAVGALAEAESLFQRALAALPGMPSAAVNLAALQATDRKDPFSAALTLRAASDANPDSVELRFELGVAFGRLQRNADARAAYEAVLERDPAHVNALNNLGVLFFDAWVNDDAEQSYRRALELQPGLFQAWSNLGNLLLRLDRLDEATVAYERALELQPGMEEALNGLGMVLNEKGDLARAERVLQEAVAAHPRTVKCLANLGTVLQRLGRLDEARTLYDRALAIEPHPGLRIRRALMLSPVMSSLDALEAERSRFESEVDALLASDLVASEEELLEYPETCFFLAYHGRNDRELLRKVAALFLAACPMLAYTAPHTLLPPADGPIRVGVVSRFLYSHAVGRFFGPVIEALAADPAFEVVLFTIGTHEDDQLRRITAASRRHVPIPVATLAHARRLIEREHLDVLVYPEIGMDPFTYLLSFARLARVQCVLHGHSVTSGVPNQDYFVSSALIEPPDGNAQYTERLVRLPSLPMHLAPPELPACPRSRGELGLPVTGTLYLCPMKLQKVHPSMDAAVARILDRDPQAQVVFIEDHDNAAWHERLRGRLDAAVGAHRARVHFVPWRRKLDEFLELILAADLVLDSFHHGGATTAHLCLASGRPMVTWVTDTSRSRFLAAYYGLLGVADCMADSPEAYVDIAVRLGTDPSWRADVTGRISASRPRLYHNDQVFQGYREFLRSVARSDRVEPPLPAPYRRLRTIESWCHEFDLPRTIVEPAQLIEVPVTRIFGQPWTQVRTPTQVPPVALAEVHDVDVVGGESLLLPVSGRAIIYDLPLRYREDRVDVTSSTLRYRLGDDALVTRGPAAEQALERGIFLCGQSTGNYYHWLFEHLPKLRALTADARYDDWPLLVDAGLHPNLRAALNRLNCARRPIIEIAPGMRQRVQRLLVPESGVTMPLDFRSGTTVQADDILFAPRALAYLRSGLLPVTVTPAGHRRLYLRRGPAGYRRLLNEPAIEAEFIAQGFEVVQTGTMDLDEQIATFAAAEMIAGPTGAAMANMAFAPTDCRLLVLYYPAVPFFYFSNLAATLGQNLMYLLGTPEELSNTIGYQLDFTVDPGRVAPALAELAQLPAPPPVTQSTWRSAEPGHDSTSAQPAQAVRFGFLMHIPELFNHYRAVWQRLPAGSFEVVNAALGEDARQITELAQVEGIDCVGAAERLQSGSRYECLVSNHPIDPSGPLPLIKRLGRINVRLMYSLGKAGWNMREWNALYDVILCFGPYQREALATVTRAALVEVGYPRFDAFFELLPRRRELLEAMGGDPDKRTVVWLPTWKDLSSVGWHDAAVAALARDFNVIVKLHPLMSQQEPDKARALRDLGLLRVVTDSSDNMPLYAVADWVLCDYGGPAFGAIYADRNLVLLDVPDAEGDPLLGEGSPDLVIRQVIAHAAPGPGTTLRALLDDAALWEEQKNVRHELRSAFFAPHLGYSGTVAAQALLHVERLVPAEGSGA